MSWTIDSDPASSLWVVELGDSESGSSWRDIEVALRNANGLLHVYLNDQYQYTFGETLAIGDVRSIDVSPTCVGVGLNGDSPFVARSGGWEPTSIYIDTAFKNGAAELGGFTLSNE